MVVWGVTQKPLNLVHGDYTRTDAWRRLRSLATVPSWDKARNCAPQLLSSEVEDIMANKRFMIVNVWRNTDSQNALKQQPLACLDCQSVGGDEVFDWVPPTGDFSVYDGFVDHPENFVAGQLCLRHRDEHKWFYYPEMTSSEALLFKTFDSAADAGPGRPRACFHTAITDPSTKPDDPERHSCEARVLVIMPAIDATR
mmetsp:Transcript_10392/g.18527  ORF Transcript_10392/g.18527 Transcript_10392/m.18527 type:complete len:198 (+) Transcript_10392:3-596(+)